MTAPLGRPGVITDFREHHVGWTTERRMNPTAGPLPRGWTAVDAAGGGDASIGSDRQLSVARAVAER